MVYPSWVGPTVEVIYTDYVPAATVPDTSSDEALARAMAAEEAQGAMQCVDAPPVAASVPSWEAWNVPAPPPRYEAEATHSANDQEVQQLCRQHTRQLSVLPQLIPESPLARALSSSLQDAASFSRFVPQVNELEVPSSSSPAGDRCRLEARLVQYGLMERQVKGDGNCQFRALSDQLYRTPRLHMFVRECVVQQLKQHPELYDAFVPEAYSTYCARMASSGTWGDHVTLQAAADYFCLKVQLITSFKDGCFLRIEPQHAGGKRVLWLSFWAEFHYNSVYPVHEPPAPLPSEKLFGSRRLFNLLYGPPSPQRVETVAPPLQLDPLFFHTV